MSKEMQLLKSKMEFYKSLLNIYDDLNYLYISNKIDYKIEECQNILSELYVKVQELKKEEENK